MRDADHDYALKFRLNCCRRCCINAGIVQSLDDVILCLTPCCSRFLLVLNFKKSYCVVRGILYTSFVDGTVPLLLTLPICSHRAVTVGRKQLLCTAGAKSLAGLEKKSRKEFDAVKRILNESLSPEAVSSMQPLVDGMVNRYVSKWRRMAEEHKVKLTPSGTAL